MHEFSIATQILESVLEFAQMRPGKVLKVHLEIGELMAVDAGQLRFCYDSTKSDTELSDSSLEIETVPAAVKCPHCQYEGPPKYLEGVLLSGSIPTLQCPTCGKAAEATRGHDCAIKKIQLLESEGGQPQIPLAGGCSEFQDANDPFINTTLPDA